VPEALTLLPPEWREDPLRTSYILGRQTLIPSTRPGMALWREALFAAMVRLAGSAMAYFRLPPGRVVELGTRLKFESFGWAFLGAAAAQSGPLLRAAIGGLRVGGGSQLQPGGATAAARPRGGAGVRVDAFRLEYRDGCGGGEGDRRARGVAVF